MNGIEQCFKKPTLLSILSWSRYSIFSLLFLVPAAHGYTFFSPRSQTVNAARELVGWQQFINIPAHDRCSYSTFSATPEYTQSFKENQLAEYFFGCPTRIFSGSQVSARVHSISPAVYEAAAIEGCSGWEMFWKITLPMTSPIILLNSIYTLTETLTNVNNPVVAALLNLTTRQRFSESAARSVVYLLVVGLLVAVIFLLGRKLVFYRE